METNTEKEYPFYNEPIVEGDTVYTLRTYIGKNGRPTQILYLNLDSRGSQNKKQKIILYKERLHSGESKNIERYHSEMSKK
jgi:hypothetical protein